MSFEACGVITLTTDFGHRGPFVATMKGQMLMRFPEARIVDLTHEILVHWPAEAGFWLARAYRYFPTGTVHVAVVDPGVGTQRDILVAVVDGHAFLGPDNGLLATVVEPHAERLLYRLDEGAKGRLGLAPPSATFHGRDIFAPVAAELAAGRWRPDELGPTVTDFVPAWVDEPTIAPGRVSGTVITVDHFGNLITNIDAPLIARFLAPVARAGSRTIHFGRTYGDVSPGDYLALINSFGVVEIARAENSAAEGLGLGRGAPVTVTESDES